jgi:hypothetical protein
MERLVAIIPACGPVRTTLNALADIYGSEGWGSCARWRLSGTCREALKGALVTQPG